jgi:hypothetical protein
MASQPAPCQSNSLSGLRAGFLGRCPGRGDRLELAFTSPSVRLKDTMPEARRMTGCAPGNEPCVCLSFEGSVQRNDTWVAQNRAGKTYAGFEGSGNARRRRAEGSLAQFVRDGAASQNSPLSANRGNRLSNAGERTGWPQAFRPPSSDARRRERGGGPTSTELSEPQS